MGASQRRKGASGEREAAHAARAYWSAPAAVRAALDQYRKSIETTADADQ